MMGKGHVPRIVFIPALLGLAIVVVPLTALLPKVQWSTFWVDITDPTTFSALMLSTKSALIAVLACVVFGLPLALVIARAPGWLSTLLRTIVTLPLVLPPLVGGVALLAVLGRTGFLGPWLERFGIAVPFTPAAIVIAQTFVALPFLVISVESALRSAGTDYERVAAGLGAGRWRILSRVTIPLIFPGLLAGIVLAFARSVGEFGATALLAGNKPGVTQTIPMAIYTAFNGVGASRQAAMALSVLLIATALAVLVILPVARGSSLGVVGMRRPASEPVQEELLQDAAVPPTGAGPSDGGERLDVDVSFAWPNFDFDAQVGVEPGQVLAVVGPNAAGKSTLLDLIAGNLAPRSGKIALGHETLSTAEKVVAPQLRRIGLLSQKPLLFPHLSVLENVAFGPRGQGVTSSGAHARARELLRHVGLAHTAQRRPQQLSGGQQQRVALARALATEPRLLLLDEPLAALDVASAPYIRRILSREIARTRVTTVLVTHDLLDVVGLAERVAVIDKGQVVEVQGVKELITRPKSAFGAALTGVNVLPHPDTGALVHFGPEDLEVELTGPGGGSPGWLGTVDLVDVVGTRVVVRVSIADRFVTVPVPLDQVGQVFPGQRVQVRPIQQARV